MSQELGHGPSLQLQNVAAKRSQNLIQLTNRKSLTKAPPQAQPTTGDVGGLLSFTNCCDKINFVFMVFLYLRNDVASILCQRTPTLAGQMARWTTEGPKSPCRALFRLRYKYPLRHILIEFGRKLLEPNNNTIILYHQNPSISTHYKTSISPPNMPYTHGEEAYYRSSQHAWIVDRRPSESKHHHHHHSHHHIPSHHQYLEQYKTIKYFTRDSRGSPVMYKVREYR